MAREKEGDQSRLLLKAIGQLKHGEAGKDVLKPDSAGYRVLADFVRRLSARRRRPAALAKMVAEDKNAPPFFDGIATALDDRMLLRRVTLSLAGRLPTPAELSAVASQGRKALPAIFDEVMKEEAFYARLREGFNDIFLTVGYDDVPENALSYEHFEKTRGWAEKYDLSSIADEKARQQAGYKVSGEYRKAMLGEPMKLIEYIVRNDHPFTEIITADYIMVTPFTSRGYGIYDELKPKFKNPEDPFEYVPVKLKKLVGRNRDEDEDSPTGFYAHAGILSTFQYMKRYPTTGDEPQSPARACVLPAIFSASMCSSLAARAFRMPPPFPPKIYKVPTMEAAECVVCHKTIDPVAGLFQDYWKFEGVYGQRKGGWFKDMFAPGYEGEDLPPGERWRSLQWLGERTAKDPRFAVAMVEHAYYILTGRKVLLPPKDLDDPLFNAKRRAYQEQRKQIESHRRALREKWFQFQERLQGLDRVRLLPSRRPCHRRRQSRAQSRTRRHRPDAHVGAPSKSNAKVAAMIFGAPWGKLKDPNRWPCSTGVSIPRK